MKVTISAAMRARDVSRPRPEQLAEAEEAEASEDGRPWDDGSAGGRDSRADGPRADGPRSDGPRSDAAEEAGLAGDVLAGPGLAGRRYHPRRRRRGSGGGGSAR